MPVIRKGDTVKVIAGKEKGKTGNVMEVLRESGRVRIEKLMTVKRHVRKGRNQANPEGGIVEQPGTVGERREDGPPREGGPRSRGQGEGPPRQADGGEVGSPTHRPAVQQAPAEGQERRRWQRD
jgi:hypothetical protein